MFNSFRFLGRRDLKRVAKDLHGLLQGRTAPADLAACREIVAQLHGHAGWSAARSQAVDRDLPSLAHLANVWVTRFGRKKKTPVLLAEHEQHLHRLVTGISGSGRTETLLSMVAPAIEAGQGLIYFDGKGNRSLSHKLLSMAERAGRIQDFRVINLMEFESHSPWNYWWRNREPDPTGRSQAWGEVDQTHTFNPLESASSADLDGWLTPLLTETMPQAPEPSSADPTVAREFLSAFLPLLVSGRDQGLWPLDAVLLSDALRFSEVLILMNHERLPLDARQRLGACLERLWGWGGSAYDHVLQAKYAPYEESFRQRLSVFAHYPGLAAQVHAGRWLASEVDWKEAIENRQIVLVQMPSMEKMPEDWSLIPNLLTRSLVWTLDGLWQAGTLPENHRAMWVFDEANHYLNEALVDVARRGRRAGVMGIWGCQDLHVLFRRSKHEGPVFSQWVTALLANISMHILMKSERAADHTDQEWAQFAPGLADNLSAEEKRSLAQDLRNQGPGEAHVKLSSHRPWIRATMVYHEAPQSSTVQLPRLPLRWSRDLVAR